MPTRSVESWVDRLVRATIRNNFVRWPTTADEGTLRAALERTNLLATVDGFEGGDDASMGSAADGPSQPSVLIANQMRDYLVVPVTHQADLLVHCSEQTLLESGWALERGSTDELAERHPFVNALVRGLDRGARLSTIDRDGILLGGDRQERFRVRLVAFS